MRKLVVLLMAGALSGCFQMPKLWVGGGVSAVVPDEETLENTYQFDVCVKVTAAMLQVEGAIGMKTYEYKVDADGSGTFEESEKGELDQMPVSVVVKYAVSAGIVRFVAGGGLVWNINDVDEIQNLTVEDSLGYKAVVGLDVKLPADFLLTVEAQYDFNEADIEGAIAGDDVNTSGLIGRVVIAYNF